MFTHVHSYVLFSHHTIYHSSFTDSYNDWDGRKDFTSTTSLHHLGARLVRMVFTNQIMRCFCTRQVSIYYIRTTIRTANSWSELWSDHHSGDVALSLIKILFADMFIIGVASRLIASANGVYLVNAVS